MRPSCWSTTLKKTALLHQSTPAEPARNALARAQESAVATVCNVQNVQNVQNDLELGG